MCNQEKLRGFLGVINEVLLLNHLFKSLNLSYDNLEIYNFWPKQLGDLNRFDFIKSYLENSEFKGELLIELFKKDFSQENKQNFVIDFIALEISNIKKFLLSFCKSYNALLYENINDLDFFNILGKSNDSLWAFANSLKPIELVKQDFVFNEINNNALLQEAKIDYSKISRVVGEQINKSIEKFGHFSFNDIIAILVGNRQEISRKYIVQLQLNNFYPLQYHQNIK